MEEVLINENKLNNKAKKITKVGKHRLRNQQEVIPSTIGGKIGLLFS